ncbi:hypothetical protein [Hoeflea sp.]|uniref:hypothetical protein n=1 Tax=Hoeflea sp. TaxID=1940281 RepID=UPI00374A8987
MASISVESIYKIQFIETRVMAAGFTKGPMRGFFFPANGPEIEFHSIKAPSQPGGREKTHS